MTTMTEPGQLWSTMPGWGIFADLTPPELTAARKLKVLRRLIVTALVVVIVLCVGGYLFASNKKSSATSALATQQARTSQLNSQIAGYAGLTQIQGTVSQVQGEITSVMKGDVAVSDFLGQIRSVLPGSMTIQSVALTISSASVSAGAAATGTGLDKSGKPLIGNVTMNGTAPSFDVLSGYVDALTKVGGAVNVIPTSTTSNSAHGTQVQYNLTFSVTNDVLSHRFDSATKGGK